MGVYNPFAELPNSCVLCDSREKCDLHREYAGRSVGRHPHCPIVEVKAPHGDLIDRNKLYEKTAEWEAQALHMVEVTMHDDDATDWKRWSTVLTERSAFKFDVAGALTIIEQEG